MSKFLKFIVNLFLTLAIIVTAGIIVPPLLGVNTTIVDTAGMDTNLPLGSVTYSRDKAVMELAAGDEILKESGSATYAYIVQEGDAASGEFTVVSATEPDASPETIILRNSVSEVVLTIPYIGFVVVAMQSLEGRIIIALVILFIIILFILSELWKKRDDDDDDDEEMTGDQGNVQAASAERTGDAGYSENVKDKRGYGTVSQNTGSITAAMVGLEAVREKRTVAEEVRAGDAPGEATAADTVSGTEMSAESVAASDSYDSGTKEPFVVPASSDRDISGLSDDLTDADVTAATEPEAPEITGNTKVFPGSLASQIKTMTAETETEGVKDFAAESGREHSAAAASPEKTGLPRAEEVIEEALIAETEKAAASWSDRPAGEEQGKEPKLLWSWTDEPFESELDGDSWNSFPARNTAGADEYPERFAPVERMTRQEILEQARTGGNEPNIHRDEVTGIDIIDYSDLL